MKLKNQPIDEDKIPEPDYDTRWKSPDSYREKGLHLNLCSFTIQEHFGETLITVEG